MSLLYFFKKNSMLNFYLKCINEHFIKKKKNERAQERLKKWLIKERMSTKK